MCTYSKNMANYKHSQLKNKSFKEIQMLFDNAIKWIDSFVPMDSEVVEGSKIQVQGSNKRTRKELDEESVKRQNLEDDAEKAKLKLCLEIVLKDDEAINVESLATKYLIVDWKTHILIKDKMYYEIIRVDGSTKLYKIFTAMLDDFDRQDVLDLYRLVKERFETTSPEGYDKLLWGDLITLFEPNHSLRSRRVFGYILLVKIKLLIKKLEDLEVSTAGEDCRKYSKSLLLVVVKLLMLVLVTATRRVSAVSYKSYTPTRTKGNEIAKPVTPLSESAYKEDRDSEQAQRDKDMHKNLALIAKYFKNIYKPTNNNLRTSSNTRNKTVDNSLRSRNDRQSGQFRT
ncbi:hypothetical protein Tco_0479499 [Tanacetum coccineum]